jgi:catechol 2,3-dioxygenase-like lactoylglutathione lyase family enzyme
MLNDGKIIAVLPSKDIAESKKFFTDTLELNEIHADDYSLAYTCGDSRLFVYETKENAGTNKATAAAFEVPDIEAAVTALKNKGVSFEHYEGLGELQGDIHVMGDMKAAWFKDPSGNIMSINNEQS